MLKSLVLVGKTVITSLQNIITHILTMKESPAERSLQ